MSHHISILPEIVRKPRYHIETNPLRDIGGKLVYGITKGTLMQI